jgi:hypothetical protein
MVRYPKFPGSGFLALPTLRGADREFVIDIDFRPDGLTFNSRTGGNRLLLFGSEHPDAIFDFFSVAITDDGQIEFRYEYRPLNNRVGVTTECCHEIRQNSVGEVAM